MLDVTFDITNLIGGFNPDRLVSFGVFAGVGANIAWDNGEAVKINDMLKPTIGGENVLRNIWDGTKVRMAGRMGINLDFNVAKNVPSSASRLRPTSSTTTITPSSPQRRLVFQLPRRREVHLRRQLQEVDQDGGRSCGSCEPRL